MPTVKSLHVYPIKSCRGIEIDKGEVTRTGFAYDRNWMVVRAEGTLKGRFLSQREMPKLALVETMLPPEVLEGPWGELPPDAALSISAPGMASLQVPLEPPIRPKLVPCSVWEWRGVGQDEGDLAAEWFSEYLDRSVRLVRYAGIPDENPAKQDPKGTRRETDPEFAPGFETAYSDGFPFLVISEASLLDLNTRLPDALPMNRFRPNIVVEGCDAWAEDTWGAVSILPSVETPAVELEGVKPCSRCKMTTIDQATADVGEQPLVVLGEFRSGSKLGMDADQPSWKSHVFVGMNLIAKQVGGHIAVGDTVEVTKVIGASSAA